MTDPLPTNWIRRLGNTSVSTSAIIAGASPLGTMLSLYGYAVAEADAIDLVQQVLKSPIRAFDTSNAYSEGESERRIGVGIAAAGGVPEDFTVITSRSATSAPSPAIGRAPPRWPARCSNCVRRPASSCANAAWRLRPSRSSCATTTSPRSRRQEEQLTRWLL